MSLIGIGELPPLPDWNYGGDTSVHGIYFPGQRAPTGPGRYSPWEWDIRMTKADFGTTLIGWANNPDLTINSEMDVSYTDGGLTDFDYSGDPAVAAALTTLQNTKGWTLIGFTF